MQDIQRQGEQEQPVPRVGETEQAIRYHARPAQHNQNGLIDFRIPFAQPDRHRLTGTRIALHIPYIIDIQHTDTEAADGTGRQQQGPVLEGMGPDQIGAQHRYQAEKHKDIDIAQPTVTIRVLAQGVTHGRPDGPCTQQHKTNRIQAPERSEGSAQHRQPEHTGQDDEQGDEPLQPANRHAAALKRIHRTLPVRTIGARERIAQFIGQVGQDLQGNRRQEKEHHPPGIDMEIGRGQHRP